VNRHYFTNLFLRAAVWCLPLFASAQDIHYTNFGWSPLNVSPALTGSFKGDARFGVNYRAQWVSVPVSYSTVSGFADFKLGKDPYRHRPFRVGAVFAYDQAGDSRLNNMSLALTGAYSLPLTKLDFLTAGVSVGGNQRRFRSSDLYFDAQYINKTFDPNAPTNENIIDGRGGFLDVNWGLNYTRQHQNDRTLINVGTGSYHINRPMRSFESSDSVKIQTRWAIYGSGAVQLTDKLDLLVDVIKQIQGPHEEFVASLGCRVHLVNKLTRKLSLEGGIAVRNRDAGIPFFNVNYNQWRASLHYDVNHSKFVNASSTVGGPEISVIYIMSKVPPMKYCPMCPTYL
jgi:type IX secretion system PorP/SprF family membrane protein